MDSIPLFSLKVMSCCAFQIIIIIYYYYYYMYSLSGLLALQVCTLVQFRPTSILQGKTIKLAFPYFNLITSYHYKL